MSVKIDFGKQHTAILGALRAAPHTTLQLYRACGVLSVSARIHELRAMGMLIDTQLITVRNRSGDRCHVAQYTLHRRRAKAKRVQKKRA
jgi:hypothetical protein